MFDLGTAQRLVPLKLSGRFCRREPTSCEQFQASSSSPGSCRRHGLRFRRMCITLVSGMPGGIRYRITNNGGYISNLKLLAIADFFLSKQARKRCSRNFFPPYSCGSQYCVWNCRVSGPGFNLRSIRDGWCVRFVWMPRGGMPAEACPESIPRHSRSAPQPKKAQTLDSPTETDKTNLLPVKNAAGSPRSNKKRNSH